MLLNSIKNEVKLKQTDSAFITQTNLPKLNESSKLLKNISLTNKNKKVFF